jgi:hypothetical protein
MPARTWSRARCAPGPAVTPVHSRSSTSERQVLEPLAPGGVPGHPHPGAVDLEAVAERGRVVLHGQHVEAHPVRPAQPLGRGDGKLVEHDLEGPLFERVPVTQLPEAPEAGPGARGAPDVEWPRPAVQEHEVQEQERPARRVVAVQVRDEELVERGPVARGEALRRDKRRGPHIDEEGRRGPPAHQEGRGAAAVEVERGPRAENQDLHRRQYRPGGRETVFSRRGRPRMM